MVPLGQRTVITDFSVQYDTVFVFGRLELAPEESSTFQFNHLVVRGGELVTSPASPLELANSAATIIVYQGGKLTLHGNKNLTCAATVSVGADAGAVKISQVSFAGVGDRIELAGGVGGSIINCRFAVTNGVAIQLSPAGLGSGYLLVGNFIEVAGVGIGIRSGSPLHTIRNNEIKLLAEGVGIEYAIHPAYRDFVWDNRTTSFVLAKNTIVGKGEGMGIKIPAMQFRKNVTLENNQVEGCQIGASIEGNRIVATGWELNGNKMGLLLGDAYLQDTQIKMGNEAGIRVIGPRPHLTDVMVHGYPVGLQVASPLASGNFVDRLQLHGVDQAIQILVPGEEGLFFPNGAEYLLPASGSPPMKASGQVSSKKIAGEDQATNASKAMHCGSHPPAELAKVDQGHHAHHHVSPPSSALHLRPRPHVANSEACTDYGDWMVCPEQSVGELTVATGHGLSDPVHEHNIPLAGMELSNAYGQWPLVADHQEATTALAAGVVYELTEAFAGDQYDLSLNWNSTSEQPAYLSIPCPHDRPMVFRALGDRLPYLTSKEKVYASSSSAYYFDSGAGTLHLAIQARGGEETVVIYNERTRTELVVDEEPTVVDVRFDADAEAMVFRYQLPPGTDAELRLTDMFGTDYQVWRGATDDSGWTTRSYPIARGKHQPGWYFLKVGNDYFKGPVAYPEPIAAGNSR
ncbi:hypothetical protein A3850_013135 [Lewinella sp. 4G2]|nr:hypothetical protein A3850_013135 [Lewinella sp. 4G2]